MMKQPSANGILQATRVRDELVNYVEAAIKSIEVHVPTDAQIHRARKKLKRARANLRLLRDTVGKAAYTRENAALRDAARPLSGVRDAAVLCETADTLLKGARRGPRRQLLLKLRRVLEQGRQKARVELRGMNAIKESAACLHAALMRIRKWNLKEADDSGLCSGLQRTYRRGREARAIACADYTNEHLHEWRKQVKYLGQSLEIWRSYGAEHAKGFVKCADQLAELLGADHDLVVYEHRLKTLDAAHPALPAIIHTIADQRDDLLNHALKKGRRLFKSKPRSFVRKITRAC